MISRYNGDVETPKKFVIPVNVEVTLVNTLLLLPAGWFWSSVILYISLGTDYFFDVLFEQMSMNFWGNILLVVMVIGLPGLAVGMNGLVYIRKKNKLAWWGLAISVIFMAAGFLAAVKRN